MSKNRQSSNRQAFNAQGLYSKTLKRRKKRLGFTIDDDAAKLLDDGLQITLQNNGDYFVEFFIADTPLYFETIGDKPRLKKSGRNETSAPRSIFIEYFGLKEHDQNKDRPAKNVMRVVYSKKVGMFKSSILAIHWLHKVGVKKIHFAGCDLHASNHENKYAYELNKIDRERIKRKPNLQKHLDDVYDELKILYPLYKERGCEWINLNPNSRLEQII